MLYKGNRSTGRLAALGAVAVSLTGLVLLTGCPAPATGNGGTGGGGTGGGTGNGAGSGTQETSGSTFAGTAVVLGYNELGMHCMNEDFSELMLLPPYNNLRAQVIQRGAEPRLLSTADVTVSYSIPANTHSADKTNFWQYAHALLGVTLANDVGLAGNGLSGTMKPTGENDWVATGIPVTPLLDSGQLDAYPLATITATGANQTLGQTQAVVPVSWEIHCDLCHNTPGISTATDILRAHDRLHGTQLEQSKPVLCAGCHADAALSAAGKPGIPPLSISMHSAHASRMGPAAQLTSACYACHPGQQTQCLRDVHFQKGMHCESCHTSMAAVGAPTRRPWVDEPSCGGCHNRAGFEFEQPGTLFRNSKGHGNVHCAACHGAPHAITPTVVAADNVQAQALQGHAGTIDTCTVCHTATPDESFFHRLGGGD